MSRTYTHDDRFSPMGTRDVDRSIWADPKMGRRKKTSVEKRHMSENSPTRTEEMSEGRSTVSWKNREGKTHCRSDYCNGTMYPGEHDESLHHKNEDHNAGMDGWIFKSTRHHKGETARVQHEACEKDVLQTGGMKYTQQHNLSDGWLVRSTTHSKSAHMQHKLKEEDVLHSGGVKYTQRHDLSDGWSFRQEEHSKSSPRTKAIEEYNKYAASKGVPLI